MKEHIINPGDSAQIHPGELGFSGATSNEAPLHVTVRAYAAHLLVVTQLVVEDDAVGLLRLGPREREAVHGGADLVHDGNYRGSCGGKKERVAQLVHFYNRC